MTSRHDNSRRAFFRRNRTGRNSTPARGFELSSFFRLFQLLLAAFLIYLSGSLLTSGAGELGEDVASCILRIAGGGVLVLLAHTLYALLMKLLKRDIQNVWSQTVGTLYAYAAVSVFLGLLHAARPSGAMGLLSPGLPGLLVVKLFPRAIGVIGIVLLGLCFIAMALFHYGRLSACGLAGIKDTWRRSPFARTSAWPAQDDGDRPVPSVSSMLDGIDKVTPPGESPVADEFTYRSEEEKGEDVPDTVSPAVGMGALGAAAAAFKSLFMHSDSGADAEFSAPESEITPESSPSYIRESSPSHFDIPAEEDLFASGTYNAEDEYTVEVYPPLDENIQMDDGDDPIPDFEISPASAASDFDEPVMEDSERDEDESLSDIDPVPVADDFTSVSHLKTSTGNNISASAPLREESISVPSSRKSVSEDALNAPVTREPEAEIESLDSMQGTDTAGERVIPAGAFPPPLDLLGPHVEICEVVDDEEARQNGFEVIETLASFGVSAELKRSVIGPTVVQYQIQLAPGVRVSKVSSLDNDIAVCLGVPAIRIEAPIPGTSYIGIELPNVNRRAVPLRQILESPTFSDERITLPIPLGQTVDGRILITDLEDLPHLLVAGTTGSGKSVFINNCIAALCYRNEPADLRFIMVDPKRVEMGIYENLPHILAKPINSSAEAVHALGWAVREMERRNDLCSQAKARNITSYNRKVLPKDRLPRIVIIVDELADLMMTAQKDVEEHIMRLAQMARAVGIHLILATQRPSVNVLTGSIKANIPARVSFSLPTGADSRTILDMTGAQQLLGKGDMLFISTRHPRPMRIQSPFMDEQMNIRVVEYLRATFGDPEYVDLEDQGNGRDGGILGYPEDERLEEAIRIVLSSGVASASGLQRQMRVGFTRAARMIDTMEALGIVSSQCGSNKPRDILVDDEEAFDLLEQSRH